MSEPIWIGSNSHQTSPTTSVFSKSPARGSPCGGSHPVTYGVDPHRELAADLIEQGYSWATLADSDPEEG